MFEITTNIFPQVISQQDMRKQGISYVKPSVKVMIDDIKKNLLSQQMKGQGKIRDQIVHKNSTDYYSNYFLEI